jgi:hypothetical protein
MKSPGLGRKKVDAAQSLTVPRAFWRFFVDEVVPAAGRITGDAHVTECIIEIDMADSSASHVGELLADVDRWFRWGEMLNDQRRKHGRDDPPSAHEYPVSAKDLTFEIAEVIHGSFKVRLKAKGTISLASVLLVVGIFMGAAKVDDLVQGQEKKQTPGSEQTIPLPPVEPSAEADSERRGIFGIRDGGADAPHEPATLRITLSNGAVVICDFFPVAVRQVDGDAAFITGIGAACIQYTELD